MQSAKVFTTGRSQAVRIPKEFRFITKEVMLKRDGNSIVLTPKEDSWMDIYHKMVALGACDIERLEPPPWKERERLL